MRARGDPRPHIFGPAEKPVCGPIRPLLPRWRKPGFRQQ